MKYFKYKSIPLEEVVVGIGERAFDEHGNLIEINVFGEAEVLVDGPLNAGEKVSTFENQTFLNMFWKLTEKNVAEYDL